MDLSTKWKEAVGSIKTWKRGNTRAPHKPLLTLILLAKAERDEHSKTTFASIREPLTLLLREFGPSRKTVHPEFPFWHLRNDGFWKVENADSMKLKKGGRSVSAKELLAANASGYVPDEFWNSLKGNRDLIWDLSERVLHEFWPETLHAAIRLAIGLNPEPPDEQAARRKKRDPRFREEVLRAYGRRCVICGYDGRLNDLPLGLEAAHIRWHAYNGPDSLENGIALCSYHHVAFDKGALGLTEAGKIQVSVDATGGEMADYMLLRFSGKPYSEPLGQYPKPAPEHIGWHSREVFRPPSRSPIRLAAVAEQKGEYGV